MSTQQKQKLITEFEDLLNRLSIPLRYENGDFAGGLCTFENKTLFILNRNLSLDQKLTIMKSEIKYLDLNNLYMRPALREFIEGTEQTEGCNDNGST